MRDKTIGCLPVVDGRKLIGLITAYDFLTVSAKLLEERLLDLRSARTQILESDVVPEHQSQYGNDTVNDLVNSDDLCASDSPKFRHAKYGASE